MLKIWLYCMNVTMVRFNDFCICYCLNFVIQSPNSVLSRIHLQNWVSTHLVKIPYTVCILKVQHSLHQIITQDTVLSLFNQSVSLYVLRDCVILQSTLRCPKSYFPDWNILCISISFMHATCPFLWGENAARLYRQVSLCVRVTFLKNIAQIKHTIPI